MSAMVSLSRLSNTPNVNVNVKPNVNVNVGTRPSYESTEEITKDKPDTGELTNVYAPLEGVGSIQSKETLSVSYPPSIHSEPEYIKLKNENEVLKLIIDMQRNNPLIYNGYIIADDVKLMKFIQLLTLADDVQLDADELGQGCISKKNYRKIHAVYVIKDGETKNLKYDYPKVTKELTDLGISTKFVW